MAIPGFIFGGDTGLTQEQITTRRRVLDAMLMRGNGAPRNIGEGLSAIGNAIAYRREKNNLAKNQTAADERRNSILSPLLGGGAPSFVDPNASASAASSDAGSQMAATDPKPATFAGNQQEFIAAMLPAAIEEGKRTGVDPRIIVAQAAHESGWGKSAPGNNYFGIKSHGKSGGNTLATTEVVDGQPVRTRDSFRAYGSPEESVRGYGDFITENPRYKPMREAQGIDAQLEALGASGYATDPNYARSVGSIARGIQLPAAAEVASLDPAAGMGAPAAIEAQAPGTGYVDPVVNAQHSPAVQAVGNAMANKPPQPPAYSPAVQAVGNAMMPPQQAMPQDQPMPAGMPPQMGAQPAPQQMAQMQPEPMAAPAQSGPSIQQLRQALMSPDLNDSDRTMISGMLQQKMQQEQAVQQEQAWRARQEYEAQMQRGDPLYKAKLATAQHEAQSGQGLINAGDGKIYDPNKREWIAAPESAGSGQFRFGGNSVEAQSLNGLMDSGALTPDQAQQLGAGKTITGPNGEIMFMTPQGVFGQSSQGSQPQPISPPSQPPGQPPQGQPQAAPNGAGMLPLTGPKTTVDERKAAGFADRMTESGTLLDKYEKEGGNVWDQFVRGNDYIPDFAENWMVSDDFQNFDQARRNFINSQLRRESGAVISSEEFDNANKQYFPQPGDTPEVIEQKRRGRQTVIQSMRRDAGPTYETQQRNGAPKRVQNPQEFEALPSGTEFIAPDGSRRRKP